MVQMKKDLLNRINELHSRIKESNIPYLVFISKDFALGKWKVTEQYALKNKKGEAVNGIDMKEFLIDDYNDYKAPEGFEGVIFIEDMGETDS